MEVQIQELEDCKVKAVYEADFSSIEAKRKEAIKQLRSVKINGFRKNKAPDNIIYHQFKNDIHNWVTKELITQAWDDVLFESKMKPIGQPECKVAELTDFKFTCEIEFSKKPDFELKNYKGLEIPKPHQPTTSSELSEQMIQELRLKHGEIAPYEGTDFVQKGDQITMDFELTTLTNEPVEGGKGEGILYSVGAPQNGFPEFDDNLLGMTAGETREFDVVMPDNATHIPKQRVHAKAVVHMGTKKTPHPLNDNLAKCEQIETYDELRSKVEQIAAAKVKNVEMAMCSDQLVKQLVAANEISVPSRFSNLEAQNIAIQQGMKWDELNDEIKSTLNTRAVDSVKLALILDSVRDVEPESVLTDTEAVGMLQQRVQAMGQDPQKFLEEGQKNGQILGILAALKNEFTLQWLLKQSKII